MVFLSQGVFFFVESIYYLGVNNIMMISLGYNCFPAMALRDINNYQPSLPFDYLANMNTTNSLLTIYNILLELQNQTFDLVKFCSTEKKIIGGDTVHYNSCNFNLNHFRKDKDLKIIAKRDGLSVEPIEIMFQRRFDRLINVFFNHTNLVFYNKDPKESKSTGFYDVIKNIIDLNPKNRIVILGNIASNEFSENITFIQSKTRSKNIKIQIKKYVSSIKDLDLFIGS